MGEINDALGAAGAGHTLRHGNLRFKVLPPTQACFAEYERWLEDRVRAKLEARKKDMTPDEYEEERREMRREINSGVYSWGTKTCLDSLRTMAGNFEFAAILVRQSHPEVSSSLVKEIAESDPDHYENVMTTVIRESAKNSKRATAEPSPSDAQ